MADPPRLFIMDQASNCCGETLACNRLTPGAPVCSHHNKTDNKTVVSRYVRLRHMNARSIWRMIDVRLVTRAVGGRCPLWHCTSDDAVSASRSSGFISECLTRGRNSLWRAPWVDIGFCRVCCCCCYCYRNLMETTKTGWWWLQRQTKQMRRQRVVGASRAGDDVTVQLFTAWFMAVVQLTLDCLVFSC